MADELAAFLDSPVVTVGDAPAGSFVRMRIVSRRVQKYARVLGWKAVDESPASVVVAGIQEAFDAHGVDWVEGNDLCVFGPRGDPPTCLAQRPARRGSSHSIAAEGLDCGDGINRCFFRDSI